ncbi:MAG: glycosyltransferase family 4 protein, partial [Flavobacteriales bacterium]
MKHIATAMGQDVLISNRYLKQISLGLPSLVAVSDFQNNSLQKSTGKRANQIIPWGMGSAEHENDTRDIDILGVGSLIPLKAFDSFLRVIAEVVKSRPKLRVVLIGDGPDRRSLEKLANELGIDRNVQFAGKKSREEVLAMMRKSKVLLHTSTFESQGFVFNEAYACG